MVVFDKNKKKSDFSNSFFTANKMKEKELETLHVLCSYISISKFSKMVVFLYPFLIHSDNHSFILRLALANILSTTDLSTHSKSAIALALISFHSYS